MHTTSILLSYIRILPMLFLYGTTQLNCMDVLARKNGCYNNTDCKNVYLQLIYTIDVHRAHTGDHAYASRYT